MSQGHRVTAAGGVTRVSVAGRCRGTLYSPIATTAYVHKQTSPAGVRFSHYQRLGSRRDGRGAFFEPLATEAPLTLQPSHQHSPDIRGALRSSCGDP